MVRTRHGYGSSRRFKIRVLFLRSPNVQRPIAPGRRRNRLVRPFEESARVPFGFETNLARIRGRTTKTAQKTYSLHYSFLKLKARLLKCRRIKNIANVYAAKRENRVELFKHNASLTVCINRNRSQSSVTHAKSISNTSLASKDDLDKNSWGGVFKIAD